MSAPGSKLLLSFLVVVGLGYGVSANWDFNVVRGSLIILVPGFYLGVSTSLTPVNVSSFFLLTCMFCLKYHFFPMEIKNVDKNGDFMCTFTVVTVSTEVN